MHFLGSCANSSNSNQTKIGYFQPPFIVAPRQRTACYQMHWLLHFGYFFFGKAVSRETNVQETDTMNGWIKFFLKKTRENMRLWIQNLKIILWFQNNSLSHGKTRENNKSYGSKTIFWSKKKTVKTVISNIK